MKKNPVEYCIMQLDNQFIGYLTNNADLGHFQKKEGYIQSRLKSLT